MLTRVNSGFSEFSRRFPVWLRFLLCFHPWIRGSWVLGYALTLRLFILPCLRLILILFHLLLRHLILSVHIYYLLYFFYFFLSFFFLCVFVFLYIYRFNIFHFFFLLYSSFLFILSCTTLFVSHSFSLLLCYMIFLLTLRVSSVSLHCSVYYIVICFYLNMHFLLL